jgi:hypothetical protein
VSSLVGGRGQSEGAGGKEEKEVRELHYELIARIEGLGRECVCLSKWFWDGEGGSETGGFYTQVLMGKEV